MTNSVIDSARAEEQEATGGTDGRTVRRVARTASRAAGRSRRLGRTAGLAVAAVLGSGAAVVRAVASGTTAQVRVAAGGSALLLALLAMRRRLALRWQLATLGVAAGGTAVLYGASGEGWPGRTGTVLVTFAVAAVVAAGAVTATWAGSSGFRRLAALIASTTLVLVPDEPGLHRLGVVGLAVTLLVTVAHNFSKATLRVTAAVVALAAVASLAWIGHRVDPPAARGDMTPSEAAGALEAVAAEAAFLRDELPCNRRPTDERLCDGLSALEDEAGEAAAGRDAGAVLAAQATLADLREQVAVRQLPADEERVARLELAEARRAEHARAAAEAATPVDRPDTRTLVTRGVDAVATDALAPVVGDETQLRLGGAGWVVLLLLVLAGYRRLETLNNRRYRAPILVDRFVTGPGDEGLAVELQAVVRNRVAELDLREPPAVPGAESTAKPTADIVAALDADQLRPATTVRGLVTRVKGLLVPAPGVTVEPTYLRADEAPVDGTRADGAGHRHDGDLARGGHGAEREDEGDHVVTVRLVTTQGRRALRARSFARSTPQAAARAAADFVVCDSLSNARLTPSWARWRSDDGAALAPYKAVLTDTGRTGPRLPLREQIELLETARAASPGTGLVLVELGHRYDLDERPLDALRTYLATKVLHPRFTQPRYRSALSLAMLASPARFAEHWLAPDRHDDRRQIADLLVETGLIARARRTRWWRRLDPRCPSDPGKAAAWLAQPDPSPGTQRDILKVFLLVARTELRALEWRVSYPGLLGGAARQAERYVWLGLLAAAQRRRVTLYGYRSARWIAELRLSLLPAQPGTRKARELRRKVDAMARRRDIGSAALYNAACFTSVLADRAPRKSREQAELEARAVYHLRRVARGGLGPVPSSGWLTTDPDLVALQAVPSFNDLVRRLADDEDRRETAGRG